MMEAVSGLRWAGAGAGGLATLSMETLELPSILTGKGAALPGPAGGGIRTRGVPGLAGLTNLMAGRGVAGLTPLTPGEAPLGASGEAPLGAGDLMAAGGLGAGDLMAPGDLMAAGGLMVLPAILTAGLAAVLLRLDLTGCLSCSPSSQSGCRMLASGSALQSRQLQLPVVASLM